MDLQGRCKADLDLAEQARAEADALESSVASRRTEPRVQRLYAQLVALNRCLTRRAKTLQARADQPLDAEPCQEDLELETELTAFLAHKVQKASRLLEHELYRPRQVWVTEDEEPLS